MSYPRHVHEPARGVPAGPAKVRPNAGVSDEDKRPCPSPTDPPAEHLPEHEEPPEEGAQRWRLEELLVRRVPREQVRHAPLRHVRPQSLSTHL